MIETIVADPNYTKWVLERGMRVVIGAGDTEHKKACASMKMAAFRFAVTDWGDLTKFNTAGDWKK